MNAGTDVQYLKGVGPAKAKLYHKLGVKTLLDLVYHFPRSYIDLSRLTEIADCRPGEEVAIRAAVFRRYGEARIRGGLSLYKFLIADETGEMALTLFNAKYTALSLHVGEEYLFYGRALYAAGKMQLSAPLIFKTSDISPFVPVYPLTAGLSSKGVSQNVRQALALLGGEIPDPIPAAIRSRYALCELSCALKSIHFPENSRAAMQARERFIFEELFTLSLSLRSLRAKTRTETDLQVLPFSPEELYRTLPFAPTSAQRRTVEEILADMAKSHPMNRLLQGDVGSGKTLVAAAAVQAAAKSGWQCAVMAPTEILADQHYHSFCSFLAPFSLNVGLLTGSTSAKEKKSLLARLLAGEISVIIGTHALLEKSVAFQRLGLVITDEQHRFGVGQRVSLQQKSQAPHVLVMSATPIPRTLALIIYGDLDISVLDELPAGRQKTDTMCIPHQKLPRAYSFIRSQLDAGRQAYIVCPLVSDEDTAALGLVAAEQTARELRDGEFKRYRVDILHGKQKPAHKEEIMRRFKSGEIQLLICTTVVEVGVDVPNATVMVCQNAERFGLAQLHQLRGRVGRGSHESFCILVSDAKGQTARERLKAMCDTTDGFKISEYDLKLRGPGDFFGGRQHGLPELRVADMAENMDVLQKAQEAALSLLEQDPALALPEHRALKAVCRRILQSVGERPN